MYVANHDRLAQSTLTWTPRNPVGGQVAGAWFDAPNELVVGGWSFANMFIDILATYTADELDDDTTGELIEPILDAAKLLKIPPA